MVSPTEMQQFVMNNIPEAKLQDVESNLKDDGCINIKHKLKGGGYTITALCPKRENPDDDF